MTDFCFGGFVCNERAFEIEKQDQGIKNQKGLSQTQLAKMAGTAQNTISSIETGQCGASAYTAALICQALECEFADCFYF